MMCDCNHISSLLLLVLIRVFSPISSSLNPVILWMNTVGPYANHQESYAFYSLPFCQGPKKGISHYHETFGEALLGVELQPSGLNIDFQGVFLCFELELRTRKSRVA